MLQQTQVKTVLPYWDRWMQALPTLAHLAAAKPEKVLILWEGLGYYSRARNLHRAAQIVAAQYGGKVPQDHAQLIALPGVGRYTAGAICSLAFNQATPILDGNVVRVLTRLYAIHGDPKKSSPQAALWALAGALVKSAARLRSPKGRQCAALNQSLMELGAIICTPRQPQCPQCPVKSYCRAKLAGQVGNLPFRRPRPPAQRRDFACFVVNNRGHFLVWRRPTTGVNAGLWEFPNVELNHAEPGDVEGLAHRNLGLARADWTELGRVKHTIMQDRIQLHIFQAHRSGPLPPRAPDARWLPDKQLRHLPFTAAHRKIIRRFLDKTD